MVGHFASRAIIGLVLVSVALNYTPFSYTVTGALLGVFILVMLLYLFFRMIHHDRRLCERCAVAMPLNPSAQAERYARRLFFVHRLQDRRFLIPFIVLLIAAIVVPSLLPGLYGQVPYTITQLGMIYLILCYSTHRRLQPWCPQCQGPGDDRVQIPDPQPAGSHT